jgi:hypothetical protein
MEQKQQKHQPVMELLTQALVAAVVLAAEENLEEAGVQVSLYFAIQTL